MYAALSSKMQSYTQPYQVKLYAALSSSAIMIRSVKVFQRTVLKKLYAALSSKTIRSLIKQNTELYAALSSKTIRSLIKQIAKIVRSLIKQ
jgi:hypothetical protein